MEELEGERVVGLCIEKEVKNAKRRVEEIEQRKLWRLTKKKK